MAAGTTRNRPAPTHRICEGKERNLRGPYGHLRCPLRAAPRPCGGAGAPLRFGSGAGLDGASRAGIGDALAAPRALLPLPYGKRGGSPVGSRRSARGGRRADPNPARTHPHNAVKEREKFAGNPRSLRAVPRACCRYLTGREEALPWAVGGVHAVAAGPTRTRPAPSHRICEGKERNLRGPCGHPRSPPARAAPRPCGGAGAPLRAVAAPNSRKTKFGNGKGVGFPSPRMQTHLLPVARRLCNRGLGGAALAVRLRNIRVFPWRTVSPAPVSRGPDVRSPRVRRAQAGVPGPERAEMTPGAPAHKR